MRNFYLLLFILTLGFGNRFVAQEILPGKQPITETAFFNLAYWNGMADKMHLNEAERRELIEGQRKLFEQEQQHIHQDVDEKDIVWVTHDAAPAKKGFGSAVINAPTCTNVDFEAGNMSNWVRSTGFNPLFNATGCCPNPNGDQTIMTGGNDPYGGFPRVWPGGGSFSLRLGSTAVGGIADRISQTFFVTPANANFTYRYALVLNDGGHTAAQQPRFTSEIIDTLGNPVPCTFYQASAGSNTFGLVSSTLGAPGNNSPVSYKNWTDVALDLTPNIGQNVTLRFTVYDCGPSGHFAYAYIDGICTNFDTAVRDTTCPNVPVTMCAPVGFLTNTWNGPGVVNNNSQCISVSAPGTYTCTTVLVPGCPGPTFVHTLVTLPNPVLTFTPSSAGPCATQYTFNSTSSISGGSITSYLWSFGDGSTSSVLNPTHTYAGPGTYQVKLKALTDRGCADSVITAVTVFPFPNISFSPPSNCINTVIQFTNTSTIAVGSITGYTWALGNGANSNLVNPTNSYTANGTYTIVLNAVSNQGCTSTLTRTLGIFPPPVVSFTANPLCDYNGTSFSPSTSTAIVSGSLVSFNWNFGDGGTSTQANPLHIYNAPGVYTVSFSAMSNHSCSASAVNVLTISPSPTVAVTTTSINACTPTFTFANNSGISDSSPLSYTWNFGGGNTNTTTAASLTYTFPSIGNYTVSLLARSNMGCTDTVHQYISIYPFPVVNFSVPASCESAIFTVSTTAVSGSVTSYNWNFGDPLSGAANTSTLQNPTHFYSTTNPYTITLNILSNQNCPSTLTVPITVFPNPLAQFTSTTLTNCSTQYSFVNSSSVQAIGASVIADYSWNFGPAGSSTLTNPSVNFPGSGTYTASLIARTNHNCRDTATATLTVFPLPQLNFTLTPSCLNVPLVIPASNSIAPSPGPSSVSSYTWNFGDGTFGGGAVPAPHTYSAHGTYVVTFSATSNMGCVASNSKTVDIFPLPSLTLSSSGNTCLGAPVQFTGTASVPLPSLLFATKIDFGGGSFSTTPTASRVYTASGTYQAVLSATTSNECVDSQTISVVIHPVPTVSFTVNNNCLNVASNFSANASISSGTVTAYNWSFGNGGTVVAQNPSYTYTSFGTFQPTVTATSNNGCIGAASNSVVVHPLPVLSFSAPNICQNQSVVFANNSTIALGSIDSYSWNFDGVGQSSLTAPSFVFNTPGIKTVTLSAASNQTCLNTAALTLTVHPNPQSTLTTINNSCINDLVTLNPNLTIVSGSIPSTTITYGDGGLSTFLGSPPLTVSHTYTAYSTYTVNITATSDNNCTQTFSSQVVVYPKPFVSFTVSNFCLNDSTNFVNLSVIPIGTISSHFWNFGAGTAATSTLSNVRYKYTATGPYTVTLTESSEPVTGLTCSLSATQVITINPLPVLSFSVNPVCEGSTTQFTNTSATAGISGWSWDFTNNGSGDSNVQNPSTTFSTSGVFTTALAALTNFGCRDTLRQQVTVFANPTPSFTTNNNCLGGVTGFTNQTVPGPGSSISAYAWNFNNGNTSSNTNTVQTYTNPGTYTPSLTAVSSQGCSRTFTSTVVIHPLPQISYSVNAVCEGGVSMFTNGSVISLGGSISSYSWSFGDGNSSTALNPSHTYSPLSTPTAPTYTYVSVLTATSNQGCVNSGTNISIIFPYPNSTVTALNSSCLNNQISFNPNLNIYTGSVPSTTVYFGDGSLNTFTTPLTISVPHTYTTFGTFTISVNAVSDQGCARSFNSSVIIYPRPFVNFTSQNHCLGDVTQFTSSVTLPGTGSVIAYNWSLPPLSTTLTGPNPSITLPGATIYTVALTAVTEPETGLFCNSTSINQVTIHALPSVSISAGNVCNGNPVLLTNHTPLQGITGWGWDFNNDGLPDSFQQQTSHTFPAPGTKTITLSAKNTFNCVSSNSVSVTVYTNPIAAFVSSSVCLGNSTTFSNSSQPGSGPVLSYSWNLGAVNLSTIFAPSITFTTFGSLPVHLLVKDNLGCSNTVTNQVEVYELPALAFVNNTACFNSLTSFTNASSISTGSIIVWRWDFDNDGTWDETVNPQPSFKYPAAGSYVCKLEAESNRNCKSQLSSSILIRPLPTANFTLNTRVCEGDKIPFTNLSTSTDGSITVNLWDFDGDGFTNSIDVDPAFVFTVSGIFNTKLQVTSQYGCNAALTRTVMVHPKAKPLFVSDVRDGCPDLCVNFQDKSIVPVGYTAKNVWDFGDGSPTVKNATNTAHCYKPGAYDVKLTLTTDSFGCTSSYFYPGFVNVYKNPVAAFVTDPEEIDEDQPIVEVRSTASDAHRTRFYISDGTNYAQNSFTHNFRKLDNKTKPMIVQVVENRAGCADTLYKLMNIKPAYVIYVPNVFTPNGDGLNDTFQAKGVGINKFLMRIFDRWGHVVYTTNDINKPWDGMLKDGEDTAKQDVYVWKAEVTDVFNKTHQLTGIVTVLR